ncbi:hypothetical protein B9Z55_023056 [Caenorhabditis nigoni]|uniref:Uncharacterized protein n=1 Tax=Caenorhabditis nigoni TaxID=1611254 RepID=A0A2G5SMY4_9PELO|nr:hypothetical protein B9Z55_023056 [Caenorhabditis nigoni]
MRGKEEGSKNSSLFYASQCIGVHNIERLPTLSGHHTICRLSLLRSRERTTVDDTPCAGQFNVCALRGCACYLLRFLSFCALVWAKASTQPILLRRTYIRKERREKEEKSVDTRRKREERGGSVWDVVTTTTMGRRV